jgi:hypothetical protein
LGLRGPRVDRYAVVIEIKVNRGLKSTKPKMVTHFLDLEGLAVRDLTHFDDHEILVLGGPVGEAPGPFSLFGWWPRYSRCAQLARLIVLYDSPDPCKRINGSRYTADWIPIQ